MSISGELIMSRYVAESISMIAGRFGHIGLCQLRTKHSLPNTSQCLWLVFSVLRAGRHGSDPPHVGYVQCKQYGFCAGENLPPYLPPFLSQIVFEEDKRGRNVKSHPSATILCIDISENLSLVRGKSASMTLQE